MAASVDMRGADLAAVANIGAQVRRDKLACAVQAMKEEMRRLGPCEWGKSDCVTMCADAIRSATGIDPIAPWRGKWSSEEEAYAFIASLGFESLKDGVGSVAAGMNWRLIPIADAVPGDLGVLALNGRQACAMLHRSGFWIVRAPKGFAALDSTHLLEAWALA